MIYLIRHGEPAFLDGKRLCLGRMDLPLSAAGQEQAKQMGLYLQRKLPNARIVSSPLLRCRQTANPAGLPYEICPELAEVDMGAGRDFPLMRSDFGGRNCMNGGAEILYIYLRPAARP